MAAGARQRALGEARLPDRQVAGKTGTTNDSVDAWFAGYQPKLVGIAWIGYGLMDEQGGLLTQNIVLFGINLLGIYRYLIRKQPPHAAQVTA